MASDWYGKRPMEQCVFTLSDPNDIFIVSKLYCSLYAPEWYS